MIRLTPTQTKDVVIDGVTFTLRPWRGIDMIAMSMARGDVREVARIAVNACVVGWHGDIEPFAPDKIDQLPGAVYAKLFAEAQDISTLKEDEVRV